MLLWFKKKQREDVKVWIAVDRQRNKISSYQVSIDSNKTEDITCRKLLNDVLYDNDSNYKLKNKINTIASDGNWSYHKIIKCNYRRIVKIKKDKKGKPIKDKDNQIKDKDKDDQIKDKDNNNKIIKTIKEKYYNNFNETTINQYSSYDSCINNINYMNYNFIDCNKHIIDKAETTLVECKWSSLRGRFARFIRRTKAYSKSFNNLCDAVFMWIHRDLLIKNIVKYSSYYGKNLQ